MTSSFSHAHDDNPETVAATEHGRVERCRHCGALLLHFGNAVLAMHATDLALLRDAVERHCRRSSRASGGRCIEFVMGDSGVGFAFDRAEITELDALLEETTDQVAARMLSNDGFESTGESMQLPKPLIRRLGRYPDARA